MFYNTNNEKGEELKASKAKASTQADKIMRSIRASSLITFSPSQINAIVLPDAPLTSVRRAMTDLTDAGKLVKTDKMTMGVYGKMEHTWKLKSETLF